MSSKDYWAEREAEALKHYVTDEKEYDKRINSIYNSMLDDVQKEIDAFYGKYAAKEGITIAEAKKKASKLDIEAYERKAKRYVKDKNFSDRANEEMRLYNLTMKVNRLEMLKANIGLELIKGHDELEKFMESILKGRTMAELERQAGILGKSIRNNAQKADAIVNSSFHNAKFSDRIWMYQDLLRADLDKLLQTGLIQGKNPRVLAREIKAKFGATTYNAERLMRTEMARVQTEAQKQSFKRNGFVKYEFIANSGCCDICSALNGKHFAVDKMMPGENAPPVHPHCRCSTAAWEDSDEYEAWLDYLGNGGSTEEWNRIKHKKLPESIEKTAKSDIMSTTNDLYHVTLDRRKVSDSGREICDQATYHKLTNTVIKKGGNIITADDEWMRYLNERGATAVTIGDSIIFRPDATTTEVVEEVYHFRQNRSGLNVQYSEKQRKVMNEIEAQEYLISVADKYHIPQAEREETKALLEMYINQMEDMKKNGEWNE